MRIKYTPTYEELVKAHELFLKNEPRDLFYKAATELISLSMDHKTNLSLTESLMVLLQTWNVSYYRFHGKVDDAHLKQIDELLDRFIIVLRDFRSRSILSLTPNEHPVINRLFNSFETVMGPVGAAKALHLLAPQFFPILDRKIAQRAYSIYLDEQGSNKSIYADFVEIVRKQCVEIIEKNPDILKDTLLKQLDEFNYCKFTINKM